MIRNLVLALVIVGAVTLVFSVVFKLFYSGPLPAQVLPVTVWRLSTNCLLLAIALGLFEVRGLLGRKGD